MESANYSNDPTMTISDVATRLSMSDQFVYRQIRSGALHSFNIGGTKRKSGAIRISELQFQEYLADQQRQATKMSVVVEPKSIKYQPDADTVSYKLNQLLNRKKA